LTEFRGTFSTRFRVIAVLVAVGLGMLAWLEEPPGPQGVSRWGTVLVAVGLALAWTSLQTFLRIDGDDLEIGYRRLLRTRKRWPIARITGFDVLDRSPIRWEARALPYASFERTTMSFHRVLVIELDRGELALLVALDDPDAAWAAIEAARCPIPGA
jgi:hypothetical protein